MKSEFYSIYIVYTVFGWLQSRITLCSLEPTARIYFKLSMNSNAVALAMSQNCLYHALFLAGCVLTVESS